MADFSSYGLLCVGVFAGAFVSGLAGFAFSAVAGAILLHVRPPSEAVPLMMACSMVVQGASLVALRNSISWQGSVALVVGGILEIPPGLYLLQHVETWAFRVGFGAFLAAYSIYMFFRPAAAYLRQSQSRHRDAMVGFAGAFIGGLTAMPGALPTIWCDLRGLPKDRQRGLVQPFIAAMQLVALLLMVLRKTIPAGVLEDFIVSLPALLTGTVAGIAMFGRVNEAAFRRVVLAILLVAGLLLLA